MDNYTLFESYLAQTLSEKDRLNFEARRKSDTDLEMAFQDHLLTQASLDLLQEEDLKSVIDDLKLQRGAKKEGTKFKWSIMAMAVAIALALVFFSKQLITTQSNPAQLMAEYYKAPLDRTTRSAADPQATTLIEINKAHKLFQAKDFSAAAKQFELIVNQTTGPERERAEWYLALSLLETEPIKAKDLIKAIAQNPIHKKYEETIKLLADPRF